ncbi:Thiamine-phosphate synthase [compost metagenome]
MLIVISDSDFKPDEGAVINQLFRSGLDLFHIRKYGADEKVLSDLIEAIDPEYRKKLVLNHHHALGQKLGLKRFHYSEKDRTDWKKRNWSGLNSGYSYSTSVHSLEGYHALPSHFSYAFLSPVFDSISKPGYQAVSFDLSKRTDTSVKLIGLGGIQADNVQQAIDMGFDGAALLGAIWNFEDPVHSFENILSKIENGSFSFPLRRGTKGEDF